jgi:dimeric dUTPase (all-alpha-NTP-PPase superfamily)
VSLEQIFEKQKELNLRINPELYNELDNNPELKRRWFLNFLLALQQEAAESVDSLNWKWWKKGDDDWDNIKIELVDMLHFWVSMCTVAGLEANEVIDLYFKKNQLNVKRQNEGYKEGTYKKYDDNGHEDNKRFVLNNDG